MTDLNKKLANVLQNCKCSCMMFENHLSATELAQLTFQTYDRDYNKSEPRPVFNIENSRHGKLTLTENELNLSNLRKNYDRYQEFNVDPDLTAITRRDVYRPIAINWQNIGSLNLGRPKVPGTENVVYRENNDTTNLDDNDLQEAEYYNKCMVKNLKFALLEKNLSVQNSIWGFFKTPFSEPRNAAIPHSLPSNTEWQHGFEWLNNLDCGLAKWSVDLNNNSMNEMLCFTKSMKKDINNFRLNMQLDNERYWCSELEDPREYISHLKHYAELINGLFSISHRALEIIWCEYLKTQSDLVNFMDAVLGR